MRRIFRLLVLVAVGLPLALAALVMFALEDTALVTGGVAFTPAHVEQAKRLLEHNDPRKMRQGVLRTVAVSQEQLDLAANYLISRYTRGASQIILRNGRATVRASFELPANPVGRYLNLDAELAQTAFLPNVERLRVGRLRIPAFVGDWILRWSIARLQHDGQYSAAADAVKRVSASEGLLRVEYEWTEQAAAQLLGGLVPADDVLRWQAYQAKLVDLTARLGGTRSVALDQLLAPMLQHAAQRSGRGGAAAENRALLVVLAFYVNNKGLAALLPAARDWPSPTPLIVTLSGRADFAQHFTISAALAATAGSPLSNAVGLYKEVDDARVGSGFSFSDIAADRAGTRFGALASARGNGAEKLHSAGRLGLRQADFMPDVRDLPEFIPEAEFKRRYGGIGQPSYQKLTAEIERRIAALALYR